MPLEKQMRIDSQYVPSDLGTISSRHGRKAGGEWVEETPSMQRTAPGFITGEDLTPIASDDICP